MLSIIDIIEETIGRWPRLPDMPSTLPAARSSRAVITGIVDIKQGRPVPTEEILEKVLADDFADVTFSGGDPMYQPEEFTKLGARHQREKPEEHLVLYRIQIRETTGESQTSSITPICRRPGRRQIQTGSP